MALIWDEDITIGGRRYRLFDVHKTKAKARASAKTTRFETGRSVRIITSKKPKRSPVGAAIFGRFAEYVEVFRRRQTARERVGEKRRRKVPFDFFE